MICGRRFWRSTNGGRAVNLQHNHNHNTIPVAKEQRQKKGYTTMTNEEQQAAAETFNAELARKSTIQRRVNEIVKRLPVQPQADYPRETVINHIIQKISETTELHLSDRDWLIGKTKTGQSADMTELVQDALLQSEFIDQESVHAAVSSGTLSVQCKADLKTPKAKVKFISQFGEDAFSKLPLTRQPKASEFNADTCTAAEYRNLTRDTKVKLISQGKLNDAIISQIMTRK
jgi:hypothetical protein